MSASPKTLIDKYAEAAKGSPVYYNMAPWELDELEAKSRASKWSNRNSWRGFTQRLEEYHGRNMEATVVQVKDEAEREAYRHVKEAIEVVKDPSILLHCFDNMEDSLDFSGRILHRWPNVNHTSYHLRWGSEHIQKEIINCLKNQSWATLLRNLVEGRQEISKGPLFELYVRHIFRKGGLSFEVKDLENGRVCDPLVIPADSPVEPLLIPTISNFPCIDLALAPDKLFQVTVSLEHPIKQAPLKNIVEAILGEKPKKNAHVGLYFVVPNSIYDKFKVQSYSTLSGGTSEKVPDIIRRHVKQYALKVDLDSALAKELKSTVTSQ
ncbi:hypothetical protein BGZ65_011039 [Modicella reniformis]|uniref:Uncharacterized protein n=1 Tax=Modicella reniformis TaxID=1440133 RepID=A0A9P6MD96_9FUNG|nr:hypothetical protein BGZ65_011039 [Modicella reniformis]